MAKQLHEGIPAKYKYKLLKYSHVRAKPAQEAVLTADPWSFLHGNLLLRIAKSKGKNRVNLERALYYSKLAEEFYKGAGLVELPAQGTLVYYGMLNLVKCMLATRGTPLETKVEHHGISLTPSMKFELQVLSATKDSVNIFAEFATALGTPVTGKSTIRLKDVISHIPELHGIGHSLGFLSKPKFLPVEIRFLTNADHTYLFTEVTFSKGAEHTLPTNKFLRANRQEYFIEGFPQAGQVVYRSKRRKRISGDLSTPYMNILKEYSKFNIASMLTRSGYRYYCDLEPGSQHHLCYSLLMMFYIGTAARYRPSEVNEALNGPLRPLVTEAVALCPRQFMYQLISQITGQVCVIPYSMI